MEEYNEKLSLDERDEDARQTPDKAKDSLSEKYFTFKLADQTYAIPVSNMVGIGPITPFRNIPAMPSFMKGITMLRGDIVPIIDLRLRLSLPPREVDGQTSIVYIQDDTQQLGFIVDSVDEVTTVDSQEFTDSRQLTDEPELEYITGISQHNGATVLHIDLVKLIENDDLKVNWY